MSLNIDSSWMKLAHWLTDDTASQISRNFSSAFNSAKDRGQQQKQFDETKAFQEKEFAERKRQFDAAHPDMNKPWMNPAVPPNPPVTASPTWTNPNDNFSSSDWNTPATPPTYGGDNFSSPDWSGMSGFEDGGRPPVAEPSIVGEKGPEVFVPDQPGTIIPNDKVGMSYDQNGTGKIAPTPITPDATGYSWDKPAPNWYSSTPNDFLTKGSYVSNPAEFTQWVKANPQAATNPNTQKGIAAVATRIATVEKINDGAAKAEMLTEHGKMVHGINSDTLKTLTKLGGDERYQEDVTRISALTGPNGYTSDAVGQTLKLKARALRDWNADNLAKGLQPTGRRDADGWPQYGPAKPTPPDLTKDPEIRHVTVKSGGKDIETLWRIGPAGRWEPYYPDGARKPGEPPDHKALMSNLDYQKKDARRALSDARKTFQMGSDPKQNAIKQKAIKPFEDAVKQAEDQYLKMSTNVSVGASSPADSPTSLPPSLQLDENGNFKQ